ncbi:MAG: O-antigen ligase family protein [Acidobacteriota bacterium]
MSTLAIRTAPARIFFWPAALVALALVAAGTGVVAVVPLVGLIGLAVVLAAPMQAVAVILLAVAVTADNPGEVPMGGKWESPLGTAGKFFYQNLHTFTGIEALRFSALELLVTLLVAIILFRKLIRDPIDDPLGLGSMPNPMKLAFGWLFAAIMFLEIYGLARGGDFRNSLWQLRQLFWMPILGVVFGNAFKSGGARVAVLRVLMGAAWVRCAMGAYFYFAICRPAGIKPDYVMTHSDSILTVVAMLIGLAALAERASRHHILMNVLLQPMLLVGLVVNNRRLAFVSLAAGIAALIVLGPPALKRFLKRSLVVMVPLLMVYAAVGWNSTSGIFKPLQMISSVSSQKDASSKTRDIENYNLIQTLKEHPVFGSGFGHEYHEVVRANSVEQFFSQYRFIAHNSVLWLLSLSGWVGFTLVWMVFPVGILIAFKAHQQSTTAVDRVTAFAAASAVLCFVLQAWGDMGLQSWLGTLTVSSLTGASGSMLMAQRRMEIGT